MIVPSTALGYPEAACKFILHLIRDRVSHSKRKILHQFGTRSGDAILVRYTPPSGILLALRCMGVYSNT